ncbi:hypothetical protein JBE04_44605, partial [Streptomyces sp. PRKS01-29]|nr:hypothetical protein [Streptomyces sabulosicollis]
MYKSQPPARHPGTGWTRVDHPGDEPPAARDRAGAQRNDAVQGPGAVPGPRGEAADRGRGPSAPVDPPYDDPSTARTRRGERTPGAGAAGHPAAGQPARADRDRPGTGGSGGQPYGQGRGHERGHDDPPEPFPDGAQPSPARYSGTRYDGPSAAPGRRAPHPGVRPDAGERTHGGGYALDAPG